MLASKKKTKSKQDAAQVERNYGTKEVNKFITEIQPQGSPAGWPVWFAGIAWPLLAKQMPILKSFLQDREDYILSCHPEDKSIILAAQKVLSPVPQFILCKILYLDNRIIIISGSDTIFISGNNYHISALGQDWRSCSSCCPGGSSTCLSDTGRLQKHTWQLLLLCH
jgi:hypothetical protein